MLCSPCVPRVCGDKVIPSFVQKIRMQELITKWLNHPRFESARLEKLGRLTRDLPVKIRHFGLGDRQLEDIRTRRSILECAVSISLEKENFRNLNAEELFGYARKLEEKYSEEIARLRFLTDRLQPEEGFLAACNQAYYLLKNFEDQEEVIRFMESPSSPSLLDSPLKEWFRDIEQHTQSASTEEKIIYGWFVHFAILNVLPAFSRHAQLARICQVLYNRFADIDACGTLFLAPELLGSQAVYKRIADQLKFKRWDDLLKSDMTSLLNFAVESHDISLRITNQELRETYWKHIEYEDLTARQRNMVNYFFDEGFRYDKPEIRGMNERQEKILDILYQQHFISTKDLSLHFRCNRKTIQRDFNELLDLGVVRQMGQGAALRYTVPIRNNPYHSLERLQNVNLSDSPVQISLFTEQQLFTKKPEQEARAISS